MTGYTSSEDYDWKELQKMNDTEIDSFIREDRYGFSEHKRYVSAPGYACKYEEDTDEQTHYAIEE